MTPAEADSFGDHLAEGSLQLDVVVHSATIVCPEAAHLDCDGLKERQVVTIGHRLRERDGEREALCGNPDMLEEAVRQVQVHAAEQMVERLHDGFKLARSVPESRASRHGQP